MFEVLSSLPAWLVWGVALGVASSVLIAVTFLVGTRVFPTRQSEEPGFSGDSRRRAEIRRYLDAIDERFVEDHPIAGRAVDFYLPARDVAITFDPATYYSVGRSDTHAVLAEHELPGVHLGTRLPFETPAVEFDDEERAGTGAGGASGAGDRPLPADAAFTVLGLPAGADDEQVKAAYRRKVKEVHPDHGGDPEEFRRVREAYATARRRAAD